MLTARGDEQDRILGLEMGADDYLPKPFNPRELSARIDAVLRRSRPQAAHRTARRRSRSSSATCRSTRARGWRGAAPGARPDDRRVRSARPPAARRRPRDPARRAGAERAAPRVLAVRPQHRYPRQQPAAQARARARRDRADQGRARHRLSVRAARTRPARTNADAPPPRQDLSVVLARRAGRQRHAGVADRVEPLARRGRSRAGRRSTRRALDMWARQESRILRREGPAGARTVRRLVRDGSRASRTTSSTPTATKCSGARRPPPVRRLVESMADWPPGTAARRPRGADHRRAGHRRARHVARRRRRLAEPVGAQPIAVRVPVAGHLRGASERRVDRPDRRGAAGGRRVLLRAGAPHRAADRSAAARRRATSPTSSCRRASTAACSSGRTSSPISAATSIAWPSGSSTW